jgi:hypothetical protein
MPVPSIETFLKLISLSTVKGKTAVPTRSFVNVQLPANLSTQVAASVLCLALCSTQDAELKKLGKPLAQLHSAVGC